MSIKRNSKPLNLTNYNMSITERESNSNGDLGIEEICLQSPMVSDDKILALNLISRSLEGVSHSDYFLSLKIELRASAFLESLDCNVPKHEGKY